MEENADEYAAGKSGNVDPPERPKVEPPKVELLLPVSVLSFARMQAKVGWFITLSEAFGQHEYLLKYFN